MRLAIAALAAAWLAGCGAPQAERPAAAPVEPLPSPLAPFVPSPADLGAAAARLEQRHRVPVSVLAAFGLELAGERALFVAYVYESFAAWRAFRELEDFEREAAEWSADPEFEVWSGGVEASLAGEAAQRAADDMFASCSAGAPGCDEASVWATALDQAGYAGCGDDRVALARLSLRPGAAPELRAAVVLDGQRCSPAVVAFPADLDGDGVSELVVESGWPDEPEAAHAGAGLSRHDALLVAGLSLEPQLSRRLVDRELLRAGGAPAPAARYWAEDLDRDGARELVIERFQVQGPCDPGPCCRLAVPAAGLTALDGPPACHPLAPRPVAPGCRPEQVERTVLSFDRERGLWL